MGLTSGRGSRGGTRRQPGRGEGRDEVHHRPGAGRHSRTSLIGGTPVGSWQPDDSTAGSRQLAGYRHGDGVSARWRLVPSALNALRRDGTGPASFRRGRRFAGRPGSTGRRLLRPGDYPASVVSVVALIVCTAMVAAGFGVSRILTASPAANAAPNPNCTIIVPARPLTAAGLATPYQLTATDPADGPCDEANDNQTAFVQAAVIDPATGSISIYDPLVVDEGTEPAVAPAVPVLPAGAVVGIWFGYNGDTLTLAGADQALATSSASPTAPTATAPTSSYDSYPASSASPAAQSAAASSEAPSSEAPEPKSPSSASSGSSSTAPTTSAQATAPASPTASASPTAPASPTASASPTAPALPTAPASPTGSTSATVDGSATPSAPPTQSASAPSAAARAVLDAAGSAPLAPGPGGANSWFNALLTTLAGLATGPDAQGSPPVEPSPTASLAPAQAASPSDTDIPPTNPDDTPAASPTPDPILEGANCIQGENFNGDFSSFTQVGACNAIAFFAAANAAIKAGKLTVPAPGNAVDGKNCLTTRSFALIDQDQSDNVTTEYLTTADGQTAQDTAANRQSLSGATLLFNGSDNGLLDLFVDPALHCSPWEEPNLADDGAPAPALPLDELQAAAWAGSDGSGPAALVPLNDPMTLDNEGNFSTDKTNTYRSIMDMPPLPAGESPSAYCADMEQIQGTRLQQDVNLLMKAPSPMPVAADNLFTFMAMRLQQSFMNLNCASFGMTNDVSTTTDGNGAVVAACFQWQAAPITAGPGNPTAGLTKCPATTSAPTSSASYG